MQNKPRIILAGLVLWSDKHLFDRLEGPRFPLPTPSGS